ncbi:hypothetical protein AB0H60_34080 [Nocardia rhamnosiphila]|uniref:relaxase/mobilization nuclease domain-containing protein n=1 Tax=Nocardia rhamnosiphila TaxID=426716 RepID=UPI0033F6B360
MMPNIVKGSDMGGLLRYLAGPGRANEHTNPTVLAGDLVTMAVYAGRIDVARASELAKLLDSPRQTVLRGEPVLVTNYRKAHALIAEGTPRKEAFEDATRDQNVWHCALSLDPKEGQLSPEKWGAIARRFMAEMGFTDAADGAPDVRWTAIHHGLTKAGGDHIHIAMSVVRPDGALVDRRRDWPRSQDAARVLEHEFGLKVLASREERSTEQATRPDERGRAERVGAVETDREALRRRVRAAAMAAESEAEFVRDLKDAGMVLRPRYAKGGTEEVVGYAVRMPAQKNLATGAWEKAVWYGGGQLSKDLTLSALRDWAGWEQGEEAHDAALEQWGKSSTTRSGRALRPSTLDEQAAIDELARWSQKMREIPLTDRAGWARAASQSAGLFAAASVRTETKPGPLDELSRQLARAGQLPAHQRRPHRDHHAGVRAVARMLWSQQSGTAASLALVSALSELLVEIREMLEATERAHTAGAMASQARRSLTKIHMRHAGINPDRPYVREPGSPPWSAAYRAAALVDRLDPGESEAAIRDAEKGWHIRRTALAGRLGGQKVDEFGHLLEDSAATKGTALARAEVPLIPTEGSERQTRSGMDLTELARLQRNSTARAERAEPDLDEDLDTSPGTEQLSLGPESGRETGQDYTMPPTPRTPPGRDLGRGFGR